MADPTITLVRTSDAQGVRNVWASVDAKGNLNIEAQDLGPGVSSFFGVGNTEYEYGLQVVVANIPRLLETIGAAPGTPVLEALAARFGGPEAFKLRTFLEQQGLAGEGWSRIGD